MYQVNSVNYEVTCWICFPVYHAWLTVTETECQDPDIRDLDSEAGGNYISAISPLVSGLYCKLVLCLVVA